MAGLNKNTVQYQLEKHIYYYSEIVKKNQEYFNRYNDTLKNISSVEVKKRRKEIKNSEETINEINIDFYTRETLRLLNYNEKNKLLYSENIKSVLLDVNDKILQKSETVRLNQLKKEDKCKIEHFNTIQDMQEGKSTDEGKSKQEKEKEKEKPLAADWLDKILDGDSMDNKENNPAVLQDRFLNSEEIATKTNDEIANFYTQKAKNSKTCVGCGKKVGMIFSIVNDKKKNTRTFEIKCASKKNTKEGMCLNTTITTDYMYYTNNVVIELRENIKRIQEDIILLKNNLLFGYDTVERTHASFAKLKRKLLDYITQYVNVLQYIMHECENPEELKNSKQELNKYLEELKKETDIERIVSNYTEHIYPLAEKIRKETYHINDVFQKNGFEGKGQYKLYQKRCSNNMYQYNINPSPTSKFQTNETEVEKNQISVKPSKKTKKDKTIKKRKGKV